jgi:hypothetical protein
MQHVKDEIAFLELLPVLDSQDAELSKVFDV